MNKTIIVSVKAAGEIVKACAWYEAQSPELDKRFIEELEYYFSSITKHPSIYKKVHKDISRCLMKIFPYVIFFSEISNDIIILRVRHKKQKLLKRYR